MPPPTPLERLAIVVAGVLLAGILIVVISGAFAGSDQGGVARISARAPQRARLTAHPEWATPAGK